ncbi:MAG: iron ABC transporter substrate-binding protein [Spirochaetales bacterium]|nr:iron ABC transporter substrate-binding protein [Spirochaetales bacterium]
MKRFAIAVIPVLFFFFHCSGEHTDDRPGSTRQVSDSLHRTVLVPDDVSRIICSGPGCLRYITYLQAQDRVVAVDSIETETTIFDARPYALANPAFKNMPVFGDFRGQDNPELILSLDPQPRLIFKTYPESGFNPVELQQKTQIPVVVIEYGDLGKNRQSFYDSLLLSGIILGKEQRAKEIVDYIEKLITDLDQRTRNITDKKTCFLGGVAFKGAHGFQSTEPGYPPFVFLNTPNAAIADSQKDLSHMDISKEKIIEWDPQVIFLDLATLQLEKKANAIQELKSDPSYRMLQAVKNETVYGVLPYNWYTQNHGSTLANAYFIGKILYPEQFKDIDPVKKADEIFTFLVGKPVFKDINTSFSNLAFTRLELK